MVQMECDSLRSYSVNRRLYSLRGLVEYQDATADDFKLETQVTQLACGPRAQGGVGNGQ